MGKTFFDSNVLICQVSDDIAKAGRAEELLLRGGFVSVQVLNEFVSVARRKIKLTWPEIHDVLSLVQSACQVIPVTIELHAEGLKIAERYGFTIYDSLIVAGALQAGCEVLYSEDLQDQQVIGPVVVRNPFKPD